MKTVKEHIKALTIATLAVAMLAGMTLAGCGQPKNNGVPKSGLTFDPPCLFLNATTHSREWVEIKGGVFPYTYDEEYPVVLNLYQDYDRVLVFVHNLSYYPEIVGYRVIAEDSVGNKGEFLVTLGISCEDYYLLEANDAS